jgi:hypothetical protein
MDRNVNWIKEFLLPDLALEMRSSVRMFLYGYDSRWIADAPVIDVHSLAQNLLDTISAYRDDSGLSGRRLVFVAHSHGGLVVKEALVLDKEVASQTIGILFFGTPHRGSALAGLGGIFSMLLNIQGGDTSILDPLNPGSHLLWNSHTMFIKALEQRSVQESLYLENFYEERKITVFKIFGIKWSRIVSSH